MHLCTSLKFYIVSDLILHIFSTLIYEQTHLSLDKEEVYIFTCDLDLLKSFCGGCGCHKTATMCKENTKLPSDTNDQVISYIIIYKQLLVCFILHSRALFC